MNFLRIAARIANQSPLHQAVLNWQKSPPGLNDSEPIESNYYLYVEDARAVENAAGNESGVVWQVIRQTESGDDYPVYESAPETFDTAAAEAAMQADTKS